MAVDAIVPRVPLEFHWINPFLAQGSYPRPPEAVWGKFDALVLCAEELQPKIRIPSGKKLFRFPIDDDIYRPVPKQVGVLAHQLARQLATLLRANKKVLITCAQGVNRSGLIAALALMYAYRMSAAQAIAMLRDKRKVGGGIYPLMNPMFEHFLLAQRVAA
jgi:protein-tyrosine phosphatase